MQREFVLVGCSVCKKSVECSVRETPGVSTNERVFYGMCRCQLEKEENDRRVEVVVITIPVRYYINTDGTVVPLDEDGNEIEVRDGN